MLRTFIITFIMCGLLESMSMLHAMDVVKPFTKKEFAQHAWPEPASAYTFNGYWPVWELEEDHTTQRLAASSQDIKEYVFDLVLSQLLIKLQGA